MGKVTVYTQLLEFAKNRPTLVKDKTNPHYGNDFVSSDAVIHLVTPLLADKGLVLSQCPKTIDGNEYLNTRITLAEDPTQFVESNTRLILEQGTMQKLGSALTYARRYSLICMLMLDSEHDAHMQDDDGELASEKKTLDKEELDRAKVKYLAEMEEIAQSGDIEAFKSCKAEYKSIPKSGGTISKYITENASQTLKEFNTKVLDIALEKTNAQSTLN